MKIIVAGLLILISIFYIFRPKREEPTIGIRLIKL
jgi:hypothetical protein